MYTERTIGKLAAHKQLRLQCALHRLPDQCSLIKQVTMAQDEAKLEALKIQFSANLEEQSLNQLDFLRTVSVDPNLQNPDVIQRAIYRYERFWLPLAADHPKECLSAPLDIEWVWHCHMLSPRAYFTDCVAIVNKVVNHVIRNQADYDEALRKSQTLWNRKYYCVREACFVDNGKCTDMNPSMFRSKITYDILSASERQALFYYQVSLPHYQDVKFVNDSGLRYKQFLYLKKMFPNVFIVPCYDIDLIWHSHQLNPVAYKNDMMTILGNLFNHDDDVTDRSEGSKLNNGYTETRNQWKNIYNESFPLFGAMYRGKPSTGKLDSISSTDMYGMCTKKTNIVIDTVSLQIKGNNSRLSNLTIQGDMCADNQTLKRWFKKTCQRTTVGLQGEYSHVWHSIGKYMFNSITANNINLSATMREGFGCFANRDMLGSTKIEIFQHIEPICNANGGQFNVSATLNAEMKLTATLRFDPPCKGPCFLILEQGNYETTIIPEQIQSFCGPVNMEILTPGTPNNCQVATHRMKNHTGQHIFTVRVIHSAPLMMSVIQIFHLDRMVAIGHLIASDQLPMPFQVNGKNIPTLNPRQGERAVLIKNNEGDWGILTGKWVGFRKGTPEVIETPTRSRRRRVPGNHGTLSMIFHNLKMDKNEILTMPYEEYRYNFSLGPMSVDLKSGVVKIDGSCTTIAEHLVLAFSVSLLHVLCVPRPSGWTEGQRVMTVISRRTKTLRSIQSDDMAFIMATGLLCSTPSNFYIRHHFGYHACAMCGSCGGYDHVGDFGDHAEELDAAQDGGDIATSAGGDGGVGDGGGCGG